MSPAIEAEAEAEAERDARPKTEDGRAKFALLAVVVKKFRKL